MILGTTLRKEYDSLFRTCVITPGKQGLISGILDSIVLKNRSRYASVEARSAIPWYIAGIIHVMECNGDFTRHLHNGDPLTQKTTHVPSGRPAWGNPPYTWEDSAVDALTGRGLDHWKDWSVSGCLYILEGYNGWGYRNFKINTPYLWSFSNQYTKGKYVSDGHYDPNAQSAQCGAAVMLRALAERGAIQIHGDTEGSQSVHALDRFAFMSVLDPNHDLVRDLQITLNEFPGVWLQVDGILGPKTVNAYKSVTGKTII